MLKSTKLLIIGLGAFSLSACDEFTKNFDEQWDKEFTESCVAESVAAGAPEEVSTELCNCVKDDLLTTLDGMVEKTNPPQDKMDAAIAKCTADILPAG